VLAPIAEQAGDTVARDTFLDVARHHLGDWFDAGSGSRYFAYDPNWRTLLGMPDSFGSARAMNDHHFHYGHFIHSAALLAMHDPDWAAGYAGMVELLIRDVANWDRGDARFPVLRNFDPYAGHSWASGNSAFDTGNNQESSSESMNFATGLILWGSVMGRDDIRDLGVYLHASEAAAIEQYWFDADDAVFPESLSRPLAGILWSDGAVYDTWWTENPEEIHGINFLPVTGGSLYLGRRPDAILDNWNLVLDQNGGRPTSGPGSSGADSRRPTPPSRSSSSRLSPIVPSNRATAGRAPSTGSAPSPPPGPSILPSGRTRRPPRPSPTASPAPTPPGTRGRSRPSSASPTGTRCWSPRATSPPIVAASAPRTSPSRSVNSGATMSGPSWPHSAMSTHSPTSTGTGSTISRMSPPTSGSTRRAATPEQRIGQCPPPTVAVLWATGMPPGAEPPAGEPQAR
jgi:hypothetical protein